MGLLQDPFANETANKAAAERFRLAARTVASVAAGDCVYIPAYWYHEVLTAEEETLAISFWYPQMLMAARVLKHWTTSDSEFEVRCRTTWIYN